MMRHTSVSFAAAVIAALAAPAWAVVLYDGSLNTTPNLQGWFMSPLPNSCTQAAAGGATTLNTTAVRADQEGYSTFFGSPLKPAMPALARGDGYTVRFDAKLNSEGHNNADRAGWSALVVGQDLWGIEIALWQGEVWAQEYDPGAGKFFTHAEGTAGFDPTAKRWRYDLAVQGSAYTLYADGSSILTGPLRNYSGSGLPPYNTPSFLFFGDDTTSADSVSELARVEVVPEPVTGVLLPAGASVMFALRRRRRPSK